MRGLQIKQSPIIRFMYDQNISKTRPATTQIRPPFIQNQIQALKDYSPNQQQSLARVFSPKKEQIHIKIVDQKDSKIIQAPIKRIRRHKIFEGSDKIEKVSSIQVKPSIVLNSPKKIELDPVNQQPSRVLYAPPVIVSCNHQEEQLKLAKQLLIKKHEIQYLKMQVERFRRCEKLSKQNQNIYKRLVQKITADTDQNILQFSRKTDKEYSQQYQNNRFQNQFQRPTTNNYKYLHEDNTAKLFEFNSSDKDYAYRARQSQTLPMMGIQDISPVLQNIFSRETIHSRPDVNQFACAIDDGTSNAITFNKQFPKQQKKRNTHKKIVKNHKLDSANYLKFQLTDLNRNLQTKCKDYTISRLIQRGNIFNSSFSERGRSSSYLNRLPTPLFL